MLKRNTGITIYNNLLFDDEPTANQIPSLVQHGRNPVFIKERDTFLLHRLYYKNRIQRMVYPDALKELSQELFISQTQIQKILMAKSDEILNIKKLSPTAKILKEKYPHIVWN